MKSDQGAGVSLVVKLLDYQSRGPAFKTTGWLQVRLPLMSTTNFWELSGKK